jgi:ubiquinone/menaquinone biosynthesis C-methylase UbiE
MRGALVALAVAGELAIAGPRAAAGPGVVDLMRERILAELALGPGMVVAEIGVGGGWFMVRVAEAIGPDGIVYGTDIDPEAIAFVRRRLAHLEPGTGRFDLRLCRDPRDTALDDLPDDGVDLILMIDSLCFDAQVSRERNIAYLHRFLRILRPGGRLVHHMDCRCDVSPEAVIAQFADAGFAPRAEVVDVSPDPDSLDPDWPCRSEAQGKRHGFLGVFRKPD